MQAFAEGEPRSIGSADARAVELVDTYRAGSALYTSPTGTVLGQGLEALPPLEPGAGYAKRLSEQVERTFERVGRATILGAIPFDAERPASLVLPRTTERAGPLPVAPRRWVTPFAAPWSQRALPSPEGYRAAVTRALGMIESGELRKVVVGRVLDLEWQERLDPGALLRGLLARRRGYGFSMHVGVERTLLGVSPELLLRRRGLSVTSQPLAGSAARAADPEEDQRAAAQLLASEKDRREHAFVVESVVRDLRRFCRVVEHAPEPSLVKTETLWHLGTEVRGLLASPRTTSLELALALHPTPAVCGHPADAARRAIGELEPFDRELFTGLVGFCDESGDGEWAVTIRAGSMEGKRVRLYAGAGIVLGSDPERELDETTTKLGTLLRVLGVPSDGEVPPWS